MLQITLLTFLIGLITSQIYLNWTLKKQLNEMKKRQNNTDLVVVKLMFHKATEIEDYETCRKIKEKMGNNFEMNKF